MGSSTPTLYTSTGHFLSARLLHLTVPRLRFDFVEKVTSMYVPALSPLARYGVQ